MIRRTAKALARLFTLLLAAIVLYLLSALLLSLLRTRPEPVHCEEKETVFVSTNGVHLYLVFPVELLPAPLRSELPLAPGVRYVSFGWGDREFYRTTPAWSDLRAGVALRALLLPTPAAMHVAGYRTPMSGWSSVALCPSQLEAMQAFLEGSFRRETGALIPVEAAGYSDRDHFFAATGRYTCFNTSNVWVNRALKRAQVPTAVWSPFERGVMWQLEGGEE